MPLQAPTLDQRTFEELVTEVRRRIPTFSPEWTDFNDSDPGITLAQLFSFLGEQLLFQVNQVPDKGFITFLQLVGAQLHPATPALADVTFDPVDATTSFVDVPVATPVETSGPPPGEKEAVVFETAGAFTALNGVLAELGSIDCNGNFVSHTASNESLSATYLPLGSADDVRDSFFLAFQLNGSPEPSDWPAGTFRLRVNIAGSTEVGEPEEVPETSRAPQRIAWSFSIASVVSSGGSKNVVFSTPIEPTLDSTLELTRSGYLEFTFSPELAAQFVRADSDVEIDFLQGLFVLRARVVREDAYEGEPPALNTVRLNTIPARAVQTVSDEALGSSTGLQFQRFQLANSPVRAGSVDIVVDESSSGGSAAEPWVEVEDIFGAGPEDRVFQLLGGSGEILFGDGTTGRIPPPADTIAGNNITAQSYQFGGGRAGNIGAETLTRPVTSTLFESTNVLPARGGDDEEDVQLGIARAPAVIRSRYRAVSLGDFEALAKETPAVRVARARALANTKPGLPPGRAPGSVTVVLVPNVKFEDSIFAPIEVPDYVARAVRAYLEPRRLVTARLFTRSADFRKVTVRATITADPNAILTQTRSASLLALQKYFHALVGGSDGHGWPFGGTVYFSRVFEQLLSAAGVLRVDQLELALDDGEFFECTDLRLCEGELLYSGEHQLFVRAAT